MKYKLCRARAQVGLMKYLDFWDLGAVCRDKIPRGSCK